MAEDRGASEIYATDDLRGCGKNRFPAFSITGGACALNCDHCQAKILEPMIPATSPAELDRKVRDLVALKDLRGKTVVLFFYPRADTPG